MTQAVKIPQLTHPLANANPNPKRLVVTDARTSAESRLLEQLSQHGVVARLESTRNGIQHIAELLRSYPTVACLDLVISCSDGGLCLGNTKLTLMTLEQHSWDLQDWFSHLHVQALWTRPQIHIYTLCAEDEIDPDLMGNLSQLTGAEVIISAING